MKVLHVTGEVAPYSKTGGLGDVLGELPPAQRALGIEARVVTPLYGFIDRSRLRRGRTLAEVHLGGRALGGRLWHDDDRHITFVDLPGLLDRPHNYGGPGGEYADNPLRFGAFCKVAAGMAGEADVFHLHDWQAGLVAMYLGGRRPVVLTVHNLAYQGLCGFEWADRLGVPRALRTYEGVEYYGRVSLLKAGLVLARGGSVRRIEAQAARGRRLVPRRAGADPAVPRARRRVARRGGWPRGADTRYLFPMLTRPSRRRHHAAAAAALLCALAGAAWTPAQDAPADPDAAADLAELRDTLTNVQANVERGRYERADGELQEWLEEDDGKAPDPELYRWAMELRFVRGDWAEAVRWATTWHDALPAEGPARGRALRRRGEVRVAMGRWEEAAADFTAADAINPADLASLVGLGELAEWQGDKKRAEELYRKAIQRYNDRPDGLDHKSADNLVAAGRAAEGLGRTAGASEGKPVGDSQMIAQANDAYAKAIRLHKKHPDAYLRSGHLFLGNHSEAQGRTFFLDVLKYNRSNPDAQAGVALARQMNFGQQALAELHAKRALDVNPSHPLATLVLARMAATAENFAGALVHIDKVLKVNPMHRDARALRAACLYMLGRTAEYDAELDQVGSRFPGWAGVPHAVAGLLGNQRRFEEAAAFEQRAIEQDPYFWQAHISMGMQLLRVGKEEEGRKAIETGREHYKFDVHATNMMKLLRKMDGFITITRPNFTMRFHPTRKRSWGPTTSSCSSRRGRPRRRTTAASSPTAPSSTRCSRRRRTSPCARWACRAWAPWAPASARS